MEVNVQQNLVFEASRAGTGLSLDPGCNMPACLLVFQMKGRTPNTPPGRDLQMERWPSGDRVSQVTTPKSPPAELVNTAESGARSQRADVSRLVTCTGRCLQSQFVSSHLEPVAYFRFIKSLTCESRQSDIRDDVTLD